MHRGSHLFDQAGVIGAVDLLLPSTLVSGTDETGAEAEGLGQPDLLRGKVASIVPAVSPV
jgi:hypothetical protein